LTSISSISSIGLSIGVNALRIGANIGNEIVNDAGTGTVGPPTSSTKLLKQNATMEGVYFGRQRETIYKTTDPTNSFTYYLLEDATSGHSKWYYLRFKGDGSTVDGNVYSDIDDLHKGGGKVVWQRFESNEERDTRVANDNSIYWVTVAPIVLVPTAATYSPVIIYNIFRGVKYAINIFAENADAYEEALNGGKHAGFLKNYRGRNANEIRKAIRSLQSGKRGIETHLDKLANPTKYVPNWKNLNPQYRQNLINDWQKEIINAKEQIQILEKLLNE
jgi:hypothetical protein